MATGDITSVTINATGWQAEVKFASLSTGGTYALGLGTNNSPTNAKLKIVVTSLGYDDAGSATTLKRTIVATKQLRKPYPNQTSTDETVSGSDVVCKFALSDYIYASDTIDSVTALAGLYTQGGNASTTSVTNITNSSGVAYPKVIGHFALEQRRAVNGSVDIEVVAFHRFGREGRPVRRVTVTATGATSSNSVTGYATRMVKSARADKIPVYVVTLNLSTAAGFTRGELVNINFTAFPWVGDSSSKLDSTTDAGAYAYQLGPLKWTIMDKLIAVVDTGSGNDSTGVASTSQATADASPCATISGALTKIAAQNNSSYSLNRVDGGEVQCKAGTYKVGKYSSQTVTNGYFTITPHSSTNRAGVVFDGYVTSQYQYTCQRFKDVTFTRASSGYLVFASGTNVMIMEGVNFTDAYTSWYSGDVNTDVEFLDCTTSNGYMCAGGNDGHSRLNRNCTYTVTGRAVIGSPQCALSVTSSNAAYPIWTYDANSVSNIVVAYCKVWKCSDYFMFVSSSVPMIGLAIVQNLVERVGASATPLLEISDNNHSNVLVLHNTFAGQRFNHENDIASAYVNKTFTNWSLAGNIFNARGDHRADIRDTDGAMIGTWSIGYSVGCTGNWTEAIAYRGDSDFWGINCNAPAAEAFTSDQNAGFVSDYSRSGTDAGNGDYHLKTSSAPRAWVNPCMLPYDLDGYARGISDPPGAYAGGGNVRKGSFA